MAVEIIDLSNYRDRNSALVAEGTYVAQIEEIESGKSRAGNPMWTVYWRYVGGEVDGLPLVDRLTISEKALFRVVGFLNALGIKTPNKRIQVDLARLVGKKALVTVADGEPYNGTTKSEVKQYARFKPAGGDSKDEFADLDIEDEEAPADKPAEDTPKAEEVKAPEVPDTSDALDLDLDDLEV